MRYASKIKMGATAATMATICRISTDMACLGIIVSRGFIADFT